MSQTKTINFDEWCNFTPKQLEASKALKNNKFLLYGGAVGGGKSYWLRRILVKLLIEYYLKYNIKGIRVGLFCEDYPSLEDRQISKVKFEFPEWLGTMNESKHEFTLSDTLGGGVLMFRNLDNPSKYLSAEFASIGVDELSRNPRDVFDFLRLRMRWPGIKANDCKLIGGTNPGGIGHGWVKQMFIDKDFPEYEPEKDKFAYIPALAMDNPYLDKGYYLQLEGLPEQMRKAYLEGDWNIFKGQFFSEWRDEVHSCPVYEIPQGVKKFRAYDHGKSAPACCKWYYIDFDGRVWCVAPETKILTADLNWIEAGSIKKGDVLAGFEEEPQHKSQRKWEKSIVESVEKIKQPSYRLTFDDGKTIVCSENHRWLIYTAGNRSKWKSTKDLKLTDRFIKVLDVWEKDNSNEGGYLAGVFDGEGSLERIKNKCGRLNFCQRNNVVWAKTVKELDKRNFRYGIYNNKGIYNDVLSLTITRKRDTMRFLGSIRPERLLEKFDFDYLGKFQAFSYPRIVKKEFIGETDVIAMKTSTSTYIAEGLASHNCYRELYQAGWDVKELAEKIVEMSGDEKYEYDIADPAIFSQTGHGESIAQMFERYSNGKISFLPAGNNRIAGWAVFHQYLKWDKNNRPMIQYYNTCRDSIRTMPTLIYNERRGNPEDLDTTGEDHCLIGDTLVDTTDGQFKIKDLVGNNGYIYTCKGIKPFNSVRRTGHKEVIKLYLENGKDIVLTLNHRILTQRGWVEAGQIDTRADSLIQLDILNNNLIVWKLKSYLRQFKSSIEKGIIYVVNIFKRMVEDCIWKYGNIITEKLKKVIISTIRMVIKPIITLIILRNYKDIDIYQNIQVKDGKIKNIGKNKLKILIMLDIWLKSGINQRKVGSGIVNTPKKKLRDGSGSQRFVQYVVKNIKHLVNSLSNRSTAIRIVKLQHYGEEEVFNLTVPEVEHFTVNKGLVVHNCADTDRYFLDSLQGNKATPMKSIYEEKQEIFKAMVANDIYGVPTKDKLNLIIDKPVIPRYDE